MTINSRDISFESSVKRVWNSLGKETGSRNFETIPPRLAGCIDPKTCAVKRIAEEFAIVFGERFEGVVKKKKEKRWIRLRYSFTLFDGKGEFDMLQNNGAVPNGRPFGRCVRSGASWYWGTINDERRLTQQLPNIFAVLAGL